MAYNNQQRSLAMEAAADLSSHQFKIVELTTTANNVQLAQLNAGFGVLQNIPQSGEAATVAVDGESKVIAGAALTVGQYVTAKSGGWAIPVNSGDAPPLKIMGQVMLGASSGGIGTITIRHMMVPNVISGDIVAALP